MRPRQIGQNGSRADKYNFYKLLTYLNVDWQRCYYAYIYFVTLSSQNLQSYIHDDPGDVCFSQIPTALYKTL